MKIGNTITKHMSATISQINPDTRIINSAASQQSSGGETSDVLSEDTVSISVAGKEKSNTFQQKLEEMRNRYRTLHDELKRAEETASGMAEECKEKIRCMRIAMRIMSGGKVPLADQRYLAEKDIELYTQAISMRIEKEDPEEYDRLSEDEKSDSVIDTNDPSDSGSEPTEIDATVEADMSPEVTAASSEPV